MRTGLELECLMVLGSVFLESLEGLLMTFIDGGLGLAGMGRERAVTGLLRTSLVVSSERELSKLDARPETMLFRLRTKKSSKN
ncbi:hypothetical protein BpHYR1_030879 [Brachionus plicatilis]|uniref:Uncharacterized protein n=1 Tax=Brachionus plicatilis TaxID=10195 RepID=A0A3M7QHT3_BRAPC|nr:hypothetical protein BpHYR1_030879 [Brachionus plicatilis]